MKVRFKLFANFREAVKKKDVEITFDGRTIGDAIGALVADFPEMKPLIYQDGRLKQYVNVLLNGQTVKHDQIGSVTVSDGNEIALFPPVSGG